MSALLPDDDRTMLALTGATGVPPRTPIYDNDTNALRPGERVFEFEITRVIGVGGFGIVYLAYDHSLQRNIALKEYMPSALAERTSALQVEVKSERHLETFDAGMRSFINEARLLAQFDHPSLVKVYRFWEANGTAYMVMPFYEGLTLKQTLQARPTPPDETWIKNLLDPLLDALDTLHQEQCFHRDIAPDNILMLSDDCPLLLDFGAARQAITGMDQSFTVILKPGYAPIEQYSDMPSMAQGAWTDIYALASVVHFAITGHAPEPSIKRMISDTQVPLAGRAGHHYSTQFLTTIDRCLAVRPENRPHNVHVLRDELLLAPRLPSRPSPRRVQPPVRRTGTVAASLKKSVGWFAGATALLVSMAAAGFFFFKNFGLSPTKTSVSVIPPKTESVTQPVATNQGSPALQQSAPTPAATSPSEGVIRAEPVIGSVSSDPIEAQGVLDQIFDARNKDHTVTINSALDKLRIGTKDKLELSVTSAKPGYVYLFMVGTNRTDFNLLFPNAADKKNHIAADEVMQFPRGGVRLGAFGPPGTDHVVAIVSDLPRKFDNAGIKYKDLFGEFSTAVVRRAPRLPPGAVPAFAGTAVCRPSSDIPDCSQSYGAARLSIVEISAKR